ncbi:MAG: hypothetical protein HYY20_04955 [Candidatus Tectomicrobia bacterium]|uniref:Uncharacterized protein n=1 Tax=Tectimicrobiota bacterium TaxID=2528274 RepID=A0A932CNA4_UNCTE|nr:hypothetical protein [Candidatus Tectomicrobia bacterium]
MRIRRGLLIGGLLGLLVLSFGQFAGSEGLNPGTLLPPAEPLKGWKAQGEPLSYRGERLIDYIDGGAELYFEYGFQEAGVQEYVHTSGATLTVEIYQLDRPENAYGIYSFDTRGEHPAIGQEATYGFGLLRFWKGRFFCRLLSLSEEKGVRQDLLALGKGIAERILEEGKRPELLSHLPRTRVVPESVRYFHQPVALSNIYYLSNENLLNLNAQTEAVFFEYQLPTQPAKVILVHYPQDADAGAAYRRFIRTYFPKEKGNKAREVLIGRAEKGEYAGIRRSKRLLILAFATKEREACRKILEEMSSVARSFIPSGPAPRTRGR